MRNNRVLAATIGVGLVLVIGLTGCAPSAPPLIVANGIDFCISNPKAHTEAFAIDAANSAHAPVTILSARITGANLRTGRSWLLPIDDGAVGIGELTPPYPSTSGWASRSGLPAVIKARTNAQVMVTVGFPAGIAGAELNGVSIDYRAADGQTRTVTSDLDAKFKTHC